MGGPDLGGVIGATVGIHGPHCVEENGGDLDGLRLGYTSEPLPDGHPLLADLRGAREASLPPAGEGRIGIDVYPSIAHPKGRRVLRLLRGAHVAILDDALAVSYRSPSATG